MGNPQPAPETFNDAITRLLKMLPADVRDDVLYNGCKASEFHAYFGRSLRNDWGLWAGGPLKDSFLSLGIDHPDDMSGILLESTFRIVRGEPVDLQGQINDCHTYWKQLGVEPQQ